MNDKHSENIKSYYYNIPIRQHIACVIEENLQNNNELLFLTTEALIDELECCVIRVKDDNNNRTRKYLDRAVTVIRDWTKIEEQHGCHEFVFNLSDILQQKNKRLAAELVDLNRTTPSTRLAYVLHQVVKRLFAAISARWLYESAVKEIEVVLRA